MRRRISDANLLAGRNCLGHTCGTNIDTEDIDFTKQQPNLTYIDKVFSFNKDTASPILFNLNTGGPNFNKFTTEFFLDGCSIFPCSLSSNAVFEIDNSFVVVEYFNTRPPGNINPSQVTLDGFPVDSVDYSNGQYTARTANVLPRIQKDRCLDRGLPTKAFFLINDAGPWDLRATYVLEGTVNTNGRNCRFRVEITNAPNSPNTMLPHCSLSDFAIRNLSLPCMINGIAPEVLFQFTAKINLVNPRLIVNCNPPAPPPTVVASAVAGEGEHHHCCCPCPPCPDVGSIFNNPCTVFLVSTLAVEPVVHVQTVRRTLFCINACEGLQPCQGSILAAEIEDDIEDCIIGGVDRPDCHCHKGKDKDCDRDCDRDDVRGVSVCRDSIVGGINTSRRHPVLDITGCNDQDIPAGVAGEVTVGTGTCEDCVWGETEGHDCRPRRRRDDDDVMGIRDRVRPCRPGRDDVLGINDRACRERLLAELCEELLGDRTGCGDGAVRGFSTNGTLGCDCNGVAGIRDRRHDRTAGQFNGCNGCTW